MSAPSGKTTFTLAEAAELLSCHKETLRRAIRNGELQAAKLGRGYRISRLDLEAFWTASGGGDLFSPGEAGTQAQSPATPKNKQKKRIEQLSLPGTSDQDKH